MSAEEIELDEETQLGMLTLGGQLRYLRLRLGWPQARAARLLGVSQPRLSLYERDIQEPRARLFLFMRAMLFKALEELEGAAE